MAKQKPFITEEQWIRLEPWRPKPTPSAKDGQSPEATGKCLTTLPGYCGVVQDGTTYLIDLWPERGANRLEDGLSHSRGARINLMCRRRAGAVLDSAPPNRCANVTMGPHLR